MPFDEVFAHGRPWNSRNNPPQQTFEQAIEQRPWDLVPASKSARNDIRAQRQEQADRSGTGSDDDDQDVEVEEQMRMELEALMEQDADEEQSQLEDGKTGND